MKKIVVTTDLSEQSRRAFNTAADLARAFGASITVLAVIEDPSQAALNFALDFPIMPDPDIKRQLRQKIETDLDTMAKNAFAGLNYQTIVAEACAAVHSEIIAVAQREHADLIVMSSLGRGSFTRLLLGSVTERVLRESKIPVLVVPAAAT